MNQTVMDEKNCREAAFAFAYYKKDLPASSDDTLTIEPMSGGLINHSYKISSNSKAPFLLQEINQRVFKKPEKLQQNYINIWQFAEFEFTDVNLPAPLYHDRGKTLYRDKNGKYWRAFEFMDNTRTHAVPGTPSQAKSTAKAFAKLTAAFDDYNLGELHIVIPDFHNLTFRYDQFLESLEGENYERMAKALPMIEEIKSRERYKHFYEVITSSAEFPQRLYHHDAKISNVLFRKSNGRVLCVVDLDTAMPGFYFSDLGDMIRSMACSHDEASTDFDQLQIRKDYYRAIVEGYLDIMDKYFTASEKKYIHYSGLIMIYMQAIRFLADYLNGDVYYKTTYPEQNYDRAKNQLTLLKRLEEFLKEEYDYKL